MKKLFAVVGVLALLGFILAGCAGNQPPTVTFVNPKDGATVTGKNVQFEVKGEDKDLAQGKQLKYSWDFGDGKGKKEGPEAKVSYQYEKPGPYTVKVVAIDDKNAKSKEVSIKITVQNAPPVAEAKATPTQGPAPLKVELDASASRDPDGQITKYEWDFGDGQKGSGVKVTHEYPEAKTYTVTLTVTDNDNATAKKNLTITVQAPPPPSGVVEVQLVLTADGKFAFDPPVVKVNPGDTVRWVCKSGCPHSATAYSTANGKAQGIPAGGPSWDSKLLSKVGDEFAFTFPADAPPGTYAYFCSPHEAAGQVGLLIVGKFTELSAEFLNSLPPMAKAEMQKLIEQAKNL